MSASTVTTASIRRRPQVVAGAAGIVPSLLKDAPKGVRATLRTPAAACQARLIRVPLKDYKGLQWSES